MRTTFKQLRACLALTVLVGMGLVPAASADVVPPPGVCDVEPVLCDLITFTLPQQTCEQGNLDACVALVVSSANNVYARADNLYEDMDQDDIPDLVEKDLCGRAVFRDALDAPNVPGECRTTTDLIAGLGSVPAFVPTGVTTSQDQDGDSLPRSVTVTGQYVVVYSEGAALLSTQSTSHTFIVDSNDFNDDVPLPVGTAKEAVADVILEVEETIEAIFGLPEDVVRIADNTGGLVFTIAERTAEDTVEELDQTGAETWNEAMATYQPIYDEVEGNAQDVIDYVNYLYDEAMKIVDSLDLDEDNVPDAAEPTLCYVENSNSPLDGSCVGNDYQPPTYVLNSIQ